MEFYHCTNSACGWSGTEPHERTERETYDGHTRELVTVSCPACYRESLDECFPCVECGEHPATIEDWCALCHASLTERGLLVDLAPTDGESDARVP